MYGEDKQEKDGRKKGKGLTYAAAGVDISAGNRAVELIKRVAGSAQRPEVLAAVGGFSGLFALPPGRYREPVLVAGTDGVGTKLKIAFLTGRHDTVGIDCVAMCVNDLLVTGAEPLFFLDYLAVGRLVPERIAAIVSGVAAGCREAGCALLGGETAEMPGFYPQDEYDLAGFAVGVVERSSIIDGQRIAPGDVLIGLVSSGLHSNGYSLVRKVFFEVAGLKVDDYVPELGCTLGEELLKPTRIYVRPLLPLCQQGLIKGLAHITGGGMTENIPRILPEGTAVEIDTTSWPVPPIFNLIEHLGQISEMEMRRTFNMGIGMVAVVAAEDVDRVLGDLTACGENAYVIGRVIGGRGEVIYR